MGYSVYVDGKRVGECTYNVTPFFSYAFDDVAGLHVLAEAQIAKNAIPLLEAALKRIAVTPDRHLESLRLAVTSRDGTPAEATAFLKQIWQACRDNREATIEL